MTEVLINGVKYLNILFLFVFIYSLYRRIKGDFADNFLSPLMIWLVSLFNFGILVIKNADLYSLKGFDTFAAVLLGFFLLVYLLSRILCKYLARTNPIFLDFAFMLIAVGLPELYRLNDKLGLRQMQFVFLGVFAYIVLQILLKLYAERIKFKIELWPIALGIIFLLLLSTQFWGSLVNGSRNWIHIGGIVIQPSEFIKIIFVYFLACTMDVQLTTKRFLLVGTAVALICGFFVLQRDLGSAFIYLAVFICFLLIRDKKFVFFGTTVLSTGLFAFIAFLSFNHIKVRVYSWLNPWKYVSNESYQITQSMFAIASGGFFGRGLTLGEPTAVPAVSTDFIFSALCEEMGILTGIGLLAVFLGLTYIGFYLAGRIKNPRAASAVLGLTVMNAIQTLVIIMGVTNLIPITGVTLPFISYGGSSMLYQFLNLSILAFLFDRFIVNEKERDREELVKLLEHRFRRKKKIAPSPVSPESTGEIYE